MEIDKFAFDSWWTDAYLLSIQNLTPGEIQALVDYHWFQLRAKQLRHNLRRQAEDDAKSTV